MCALSQSDMIHLDYFCAVGLTMSTCCGIPVGHCAASCHRHEVFNLDEAVWLHVERDVSVS